MSHYYYQVVPNSHSFGCLSNIIILYSVKPEVLTKEYLLIGFRNTLKREYEIKQYDQPMNDGPIFCSIESIIKYIEQPEFNLDVFVEVIKSTIYNNIDLKCKRKMEREEVYRLIDGERDYQDNTWVARRTADGTPDEEKPVAEWINYIEYHLSKAKERVYHLDTQAALAEIRKVTALGVRAIEIHGAPQRIIKSDTAPNGCTCDNCECKK